MAAPAGRDFSSGAVLIAIGAFFAWTGRGLAMTEGDAMGAGYFPRLLAALLIVLGAAIVVKSARAQPESRALAPIPWRAVLLLSAALAWFALTVRPLGLGPALTGAIGLSCAASPRARLATSVMLTGGIVLFAWLVFVLALKMPVPMLGAWLRTS